MLMISSPTKSMTPKLQHTHREIINSDRHRGGRLQAKCRKDSAAHRFSGARGSLCGWDLVHRPGRKDKEWSCYRMGTVRVLYMDSDDKLR
jgi:hypothetical protein